MREALQSFTEALCAANGPPPLFALLLVGNVRTFYEPRVYKSIRANLIDALGAPSVAFLYGKLDAELVRGTTRSGVKIKPTDKESAHGFSGGPRRSYGQRMEELHRAAEFLSSNGGPEVVMKVVNSSHASHYINQRCPWLAWAGRERWFWETAFAGQLQSHAIGYDMMEAYEAKHQRYFTSVAKVRLDGMWLASIRPWCTYRLDAAYTIFPQPQDWFFMVPRRAAKLVFLEPFRRYQNCSALKDMDALQAQTKHGYPCCGGNGPNAIIMGTLELARIPMIGCLVDMGQPSAARPASYPAGSAVMPWLFNVVLLRDETVNEWCTNKYLVPSRPNPTQFEGSAMAAKRGVGSAEGRKTAELVDWSWSYFYDVASCMRLLDPEEYRYNHTRSY